MKRHALLLKILVSTTLLGWLVSHAEWRPLRERLTTLSPGYYVLGVLILLGYVGLQACILRQLLAPRGERPRLRGIVRHMLISLFFGVFLPGGNGADVVLCYRLFRSPTDNAQVLSAIAFSRLGALAATIAVAFLASFIPGCPVPGLRAVSLTLLVVGAAAYAVVLWGWEAPPVVRAIAVLRRRRLTAFVCRTLDALAEVGRDRHTLVRVVPGLLLVGVLRVVIDYVASLALGLQIPLKYFFAFAPAVTVASTVPLTISGLGIREGTYVGLMGTVGVPAADALAVSLLSFTFVLWLCLLGAALYATIRRSVIVVASAALVAAAVTQEALVFRHTRASRQLQHLTGARTRMVWCRQVSGDGTDVQTVGAELQLMGLDTSDRRGEHPLLRRIGNYHDPRITPRGDRVVFTDVRSSKIFALQWDGPHPHELALGHVLDVWQDPVSQEEWIYAVPSQPTREDSTNTVIRFLIDEPSRQETVWTATPVDGDGFCVSGDGNRAAGLFPWPKGGIADLRTGDVRGYGRGCWTGLSPGSGAFLWIFSDTHRNVTLYATETDRQWSVRLEGAPGIDGHEVYHPRWSNDLRTLSMTGPYREGNGRNPVRAGGKGVEVYVGRFNAKLTEVAEWVRVTHNRVPDFSPAVWVDPIQ